MSEIALQAAPAEETEKKETSNEKIEIEIEQQKEDTQKDPNPANADQSDNVIIREEDPSTYSGYEDKTNYNVFNVKREGYFFADEVKVDGETIFTIPFDQQVEDSAEVPKRTSRWGDRPQRRKKAQVNLIFNPLQGMATGNGMLSITADGYKPGDKITLSKEEEEEEAKYSKWGPEYEKTFHPPLLNFIPHTVNDDDLEYIIRLYRLDEIQNKMSNKSKTIFDDDDCRSPSPPYVYNEAGKRINTRDQREAESLQKERSNLIEESLRINPTFVPPHDYKIQKKQKKIYLPEQNSELLKQKVIGQKGATHKKLEADSGCKISIKGKGSTNGLKRVENDANEKLHILIMGSTDEQIDKATELINEILKGEEKPNPEQQNTQIAIISNYLGQEFCSKCHQTGHKHWECTNKPAFEKVELKCDICGDKGHVTSDCKFKKDYALRQQQMKDKPAESDVRSQFEQFINEVEGDKKLLTQGYGYPTAKPQQSITATSFITDTVTIDPNMLMIQSEGRPYDSMLEGSHSHTNFGGQLNPPQQDKFKDQRPAYESFHSAAPRTFREPPPLRQNIPQPLQPPVYPPEQQFGQHSFAQPPPAIPFQNPSYYPQQPYPYYQGGFYPQNPYGMQNMYMPYMPQMYPPPVMNHFPPPSMPPPQLDQQKPPFN